MTKTEWFKKANGRRVKKTVTGIPTQEDKTDIIANIKRQLVEQGADENEIIVDDNKVTIGGQFWLLPKMKKEVVGVFTTRSKDYIHNNIFGDKKDAKINDNGNMVIHIPNTENGLITYEILD